MDEQISGNTGDQDLLQKYYDTGDNQHLGQLLENYTLLLLGLCMKYLKNEEEAKDAVQQIFLKVITEVPKYKVDYFKGWLYTIARNHCLMKLRNKYRTISTEMVDYEKPEEEPLMSAIQKDQLLILAGQSLNELNAEQKACVTLFYLEKKTYAEISEKTGFSLLQVKSFIQNGKRNLKNIIQKKLAVNG